MLGKSKFIVALALVVLALGCSNDPSGSTIAICIDPATGLVSWWPGDGDANDIAGSNHGTVENGATFVQGYADQAFNFDGTGMHIGIVDDASLDGFAGITVDAWIRTSNSVANRAILSKYQHNSGGNLDDSYYLGLNNGTVLWQINAGDSYNGLTGSVDFADGQWHHIAGTWDGTNQIIYVDGVMQNSMLYSGTGTINSTTEPVAIGRSMDNGVPGRLFDGDIDEVDLFDRALEASEIQAIYDANTAGKCKP